MSSVSDSVFTLLLQSTGNLHKALPWLPVSPRQSDGLSFLHGSPFPCTFESIFHNPHWTLLCLEPSFLVSSPCRHVTPHFINIVKLFPVEVPVWSSNLLPIIMWFFISVLSKKGKPLKSHKPMGTFLDLNIFFNSTQIEFCCPNSTESVPAGGETAVSRDGFQPCGPVLIFSTFLTYFPLKPQRALPTRLGFFTASSKAPLFPAPAWFTGVGSHFSSLNSVSMSGGIPCAHNPSYHLAWRVLFRRRTPCSFTHGAHLSVSSLNFSPPFPSTPVFVLLSLSCLTLPHRCTLKSSTLKPGNQGIF